MATLGTSVETSYGPGGPGASGGIRATAWADRDAGESVGEQIIITDTILAGLVFVWNGTRWVSPTGEHVIRPRGGSANHTGSATASAALLNDVIPGGLLFDGAGFEVNWDTVGDADAGTIAVRGYVGGQLMALNTTGASGRSQRVKDQAVEVEDDGSYSLPAAASALGGSAGTTAHLEHTGGTNIDWSADVTVHYTITNSTTTKNSSIRRRYYRVLY